jgi:hypothetical protein
MEDMRTVGMEMNTLDRLAKHVSTKMGTFINDQAPLTGLLSMVSERCSK